MFTSGYLLLSNECHLLRKIKSFCAVAGLSPTWDHGVLLSKVGPLGKKKVPHFFTNDSPMGQEYIFGRLATLLLFCNLTSLLLDS